VVAAVSLRVPLAAVADLVGDRIPVHRVEGVEDGDAVDGDRDRAPVRHAGLAAAAGFGSVTSTDWVVTRFGLRSYLYAAEPAATG
jgi:hypothetical protein